jgi:hypothetical protein
MYVTHPRVFLGLGLVFIPISFAIAALQWLLISGLDAIGSVTGDLAGLFAHLAVIVATSLTLLTLALVIAATARALVELDERREVGPTAAYRLAMEGIRPLLPATATAVVVWVLLGATGILLPVALWLAVKWALFAPVAQLEETHGVRPLRRSAELVRGRWLRVASLVGVSAVVALLAGPLVGALLIFVSSAPLAVLNLVAGVVYAVALPFVALVTCYVYFDARTRHELEHEDAPDELPAEIVLGR